MLLLCLRLLIFLLILGCRFLWLLHWLLLLHHDWLAVKLLAEPVRGVIEFGLFNEPADFSWQAVTHLFGDVYRLELVA